MPDFDAYLMVDWSANSKPKIGQDSIWYYMATRARRSCHLANPPTRGQAVMEIANLLAENVAWGYFTLVGFDFPYGYPTPFAARLGFKHEQGPLWEQVWDLLRRLIKDDEKNRSNRFLIASELNRQLSGVSYPFWGCPKSAETITLTSRKFRGTPETTFSESRFTEKKVKMAQPVWKLFGAGSVGSQSLLGIPYLSRLRFDPRVAKVSQVWPFETGLRKPPARRKRDWLVLHAEIFPGIIPHTPREAETRDAAQVRTLAHYFAKLDMEGKLPYLFEGQSQLGLNERRIVESEEGWILGVR